MQPRVELDILPQPDDATCGPTCLHAVYRYFGDALPLDSVIGEVEAVSIGGTLAVNLARHALRRGYAATIYTYNLDMFDPTWFEGGRVDVAARLRDQARHKPDPKLREATGAYLDFLELGGRIDHQELSRAFLARLLEKGPIITGLSATYLYSCEREYGERKLVADDVRGYPTGHFVVLAGYDPARGQVVVADPLEDRPGFDSHLYPVAVDRVLGAILLGVLSYDANLTVLRPPGGGSAP
jgi:hypothetical protein